MKIVDYEIPHSSFLSVEKDMEIITNKFLKIIFYVSILDSYLNFHLISYFFPPLDSNPSQCVSSSYPFLY